MSFFAIAVILLLGIFLLLIEFLLIPGITVFGIGGFLFLIAGVGAAYYYHGATAGNLTLLFTVAGSVSTLYVVFKQKTWRRLGLSANINSRVQPFETGRIAEGETGKTLTRLAPVGNALVNDITCEAHSQSGIIEPNTDIEVIRVMQTYIIVKPKTI